MTVPRIVTDDLGGAALASAAQRGDLPAWYRVRPSGTSAWQAYVESVARPYVGGGWLRELTPALAPGAAAARRLEGVAKEGGVVVSTGQQAALFGGPLYTILKALSALAVADAVERETGTPAAPVFWAATDDADFAEACCAHVERDGGLHTLRLTPPEREGVAMADVPLRDIEPLVRTLADACGSVADESPLRAVRHSHREGSTLGAAYVELLRSLFEPLGIAVLDASHTAVRRASMPLLSRALERAAAIESALEERTTAIRAAAFKPRVELVPGLSLVFAADAGEAKRRIPITEAADVSRRRALASLAPNVLLRPLVEAAIMPSAAYVAGPGEIAYFAQVSAVATILDTAAPLVLPRWSAMIVEPRIERLLGRLGVTREALEAPHAVEARLARAALDPEIASALETLRARLDADVAAIARADRTGLVPPASLEALRRAALHRLSRVERRYLAAVKRREAGLMRDVATVRAALYPNGKRQERVLNFIPFLARNGRPLVDAMRGEAAKHAERLVGQGDSPRHATGATIAERV